MPTTTVIVIKMEFVVLKRKTRETNKQICMTNQIKISFSISHYETFSKFQGSEKLPHIF